MMMMMMWMWMWMIIIVAHDYSVNDAIISKFIAIVIGFYLQEIRRRRRRLRIRVPFVHVNLDVGWLITIPFYSIASLVFFINDCIACALVLVLVLNPIRCQVK